MCSLSESAPKPIADGGFQHVVIAHAQLEKTGFIEIFQLGRLHHFKGDRLRFHEIYVCSDEPLRGVCQALSP